jgi:hypothetical protein
MATFDLRLPTDRAALGLDDDWDKKPAPHETVLKPSHQIGGGGHHRAKGEALKMICEVVTSAPQPMTRLEIARAINRAKSPYIISLIMELVESGDIVELAGVRPNRSIEYRYWRAS